MTRIDRQQLLHTLDLLKPGLSAKGLIDQSDCYVFRKGKALTFNGEVCCRTACDLGGFEGAVKGGPLAAVLAKMSDDTLEVEPGDGTVRFHGRRKKLEVTAEAEVRLPVAAVDRPGEWKRLPEEFVDALRLVQDCAGSDESRYVTTCVHLTPKWLEATNNNQAARYRTALPVTGPMLVRKDAVKHVLDVGVTELAESANWLHFRNPAGLVLSVRRRADPYVNLTPHLKPAAGGAAVVLPKGLKLILDCAAVFSGEDKERDEVTVGLKPGKVRLTGRGASGSYSEWTKVGYDGPPLEFAAAPDLLKQLVDRFDGCVVTEDRLRIEGGSFVYVSALARPAKRPPNGDDYGRG